MILNMIGSGGVGLNFKIVGGTAEPVSPSENMIWVNTDVEFTSWSLSATEPENPAENMVWVCVGTASNVVLNALKKNSIVVYPIGGKQYIGGTWVKKEVQVYQNGVWNTILRTQYIFTEKQGAIVPLSTSTQEYIFSVSITNDHIYGYGYKHSDSAVNVSVWTETEKDLFGYTTLYFDIAIPTTWPNGTITFGVSRDPIKAADSATMPFIAKQQVGVCERKTIAIDISDIDKGYVGVCGCGNYYIYNWWYE